MAGRDHVFSLVIALALQTTPVQTESERIAPRSLTVPRVVAEIQLDGRLDEPVWSQAARATDFWQREPVDSRPAEERSEVLVWYSPQALHFGIVAHDRDAALIRATVADRDNLSQDDSVSLFLDTFNDRRRAYVFTVNPLGIQEDGVYSEGVSGAGRLGGGNLDKNPDYRFDSQGRVTEDGYVVEVRIPFKSLGYSGTAAQSWGFNILRRIQRTGYEDSWTQVRRLGPSFLSQAGILDGLHDLERGVVMEVQPFVTGANAGFRDDVGDTFVRAPVDLSGGVNARLGFTNLSIDATVNPDFSQVEADAGLVTINERFALFFPEKRLFFLEGIELFATPNQLVYTRQIVDPIAGGKVTGKLGAFGLAHLTAVDDTPDGDALFNVTRLRRDFGQNSLAGVTYTDRVGAGGFNRVLAADVRVVFARLYYIQAQAGQSWTGLGDNRQDAPIWNLVYDRTGRAWGFNYTVNAIGEGFESRAGFVPRSDLVTAHGLNRLTFYGDRGAFIESLSLRFIPTRRWRFGQFLRESPIEGEDNLNLQLRLRGDWNLNGTLQREYYRFDARDYEGYEVDRGGRLEPYIPPDRADNLYIGGVNLSTPTFQTFNARVDLSLGEAPIFPEAAHGRETRLVASVAVRPSSSIRTELTTTVSNITRGLDGSQFARTIIPRLKLEYQPRRSLFFRFIGEYRSQRRADLRDARTGAAIVVNGSPQVGREQNGLRVDWLASYEPTPGTAAYFGYGSSLEGDRTLTFADLRRANDGFFAKLAYQFRW